MLLIDKQLNVFGGALIIQKKLLQIREAPFELSFYDKQINFENRRKNLPKITNQSKNVKADDLSSDIRKNKFFVFTKPIKLKNSLNEPINKTNKISINSIKKIKKLKRSASSNDDNSIRSLNHSASKNLFKESTRNTFDRSSISNIFKSPKKLEQKNAFKYHPIDFMKQNNQKVNLENTNEQVQLDKRQRFDIYMRCLESKQGASSVKDAIELINKTLDEIEEKYAPKKEDKLFGINSKKYGRMWPIPEDRIKVNPETGKTEMLTTGLNITIDEDGSFEIWTLKRGNFDVKKLFHKKSSKIVNFA